MPQPAQDFYNPQVRLDDEGGLSNKRMEQQALLIADGVEPLDAWRLTSPKESKSDGGTYRANMHNSKVFKGRVKTLMDRQEELLTKGIWGRVQWGAEVMYATGRAKNDDALAMKALEIMMKSADRLEGAPKPKDPNGQSNRGAPSAEMPAEPDPEDNVLRRQLIEKAG